MSKPLAVDARCTAERRLASVAPSTSESGILIADPSGKDSRSWKIPPSRSWCFPRRVLRMSARITRSYLGALFCVLSLLSLAIRTSFLVTALILPYIILLFGCQALCCKLIYNSVIIRYRYYIDAYSFHQSSSSARFFNSYERFPVISFSAADAVVDDISQYSHPFLVGPVRWEGRVRWAHDHKLAGSLSSSDARTS